MKHSMHILVLCLLSVAALTRAQQPHTLAIIGSASELLWLCSPVHEFQSLYGNQAIEVVFAVYPTRYMRSLMRGCKLQSGAQLPAIESGGDHSRYVSSRIEQISDYLRSISTLPTVVLVQGDSSTALAAAMSAFYIHVPVVHLDSGMRSWERSNPYPNEFNRRAISLIATLSFTSSENGKEHLVRDGVDLDAIYVVGNPVFDLAGAAHDSPLPDSDLRILHDIYSPAGNDIINVVIVDVSADVPLLETIRAARVVRAADPSVMFRFLSWDWTSQSKKYDQELLLIPGVMVIDGNEISHALYISLLRRARLVITDRSLEAMPSRVSRTLLISENHWSVDGILPTLTTIVIPVSSVIESSVRELLVDQDTTENLSMRSDYSFFEDGKAGRRVACRLGRLTGLNGAEELGPCHDSRAAGREFDHVSDQTPASKEHSTHAEITVVDTSKVTTEGNGAKSSLPLGRHLGFLEGPQQAAAVDVLKTFSLNEHPDRLFGNNYNHGRISVIMTQYKRNTTEMQLRALFGQSVFSRIERIVIFQNEKHVDLTFLNYIDFTEYIIEEPTTNTMDRLVRNRFKKDGCKHSIIEILQSESNFMYHGRFALALLFDSEYTIVLDDDTMPQEMWLEYSMEMSARYNAIVGPIGVVVGANMQYYLNPPLDFHVEVDYTGHSWTFQTRWLRYLWGSHSPSWDAGEDIAFSALAWLKGRVRTIVPRMPNRNKKYWGDMLSSLHEDGQQTHTRPVPAAVRWPLTRYWVAQGWIPAMARDYAIGANQTCFGIAACQIFYQKLRQSSGIPEMTRALRNLVDTRYQRQRLLSHFIAVPNMDMTFTGDLNISLQ